MHQLIKHLADNKFDLFTNLLTSLISFFAALFLNGALERRRERREFKNLLRSVASEANNNSNILEKSFSENLGGIITRPLTTVCTESAIASPLFVRYATKKNHEVIMSYYRQLVLLNGNRQLHYDLTLSADKPADKQMMMRELLEVMQERITDAHGFISKVVKLSE